MDELTSIINKIIEDLSDDRVIQLVTELGSDEYINKPDYIIFTSIYILLCTGAGLFLADSIKNLKTN